MKRFVLLALLAAPALAHADSSKESSSPPSSRKLQREWQVDSRLFAADKEAPDSRKGGLDATRRPSPKLDK
ncbi:MAG TPA: hypothetical protein VFF06_32155 [Polyangia bacterium]|nr:hypothetical protein [Polyangia bacterium]